MDEELARGLGRIGLGGLKSGADAGLVLDTVELQPLEAARRLTGRRRLAFLDSSMAGGPAGRYSYVAADPFLVVRSRSRQVELRSSAGTTAIRADPFEVVAKLLRHLRIPALDGLPAFMGGAIGSFGYDLGRLLERIPDRLQADPDVPELDLAFYDQVLAFDHQANTGWLIKLDLGVADDRRPPLGELLATARSSAPVMPAPQASAPRASAAPMAMRSNVARVDYLARVRRVLAEIAAGELYQVNLSHRLEGAWHASGWEAYERLRAASPAPYGAFLDLDETTLLSVSPERFLRLDGSCVETRPMKGTRPRGARPAQDRAIAAELAGSAKDRAENAMIVDVLRNDLGRVCLTGSVRVNELCAVEPHAGVWQMVSSISGELRPGLDAMDLLRACFPGGSISGAPKIRAMQLIEQLEQVRRGAYCGAIGYLSVTGAMDTSVAIRTVVLADERLLLQVGGGIVADSDPEAEYAETLVKARTALAALGARLEEW